MISSKKLARSLVRIAGLLFLVLIVPVLGFLGAAAIGAFIPRDVPSSVAEAASANASDTQDTVTIFLLTSPLHADIAIPFDGDLLARFPWLKETRLPLDNPRLAYLAFGWGSKAFYTTAGNYSDIGLSNTFTAVTGDSSVMRVIGLALLEAGSDTIPVELDAGEYQLLITQIKSGFSVKNDGKPEYLPQYSIGHNDAFFAGTGHFNIFHPCNQWAADVLSASGLSLGRWTPTTYSLLWSLRWNNEIQ